MSIVPYGFVSPTVRDFRPPETSELVPIKATGLVGDRYTLYQGVPTVPEIWVEGNAAVTADGTHYADRVAITEINDDVLARFVPTSDTFDTTAFVWSPLISQTISRYEFDADPASAPVLTEVDYTIGREIFTINALDFADTSVLTASFDSGFDDAYSLTVAAAVNFRDFDFTWLTFGDGSWVKVTASGLQARLAGHTVNLKTTAAPITHFPLYVVLKVAPPKAYLAAGYSGSRLAVASTPVPVRTTSLTMTLTGNHELFSLDLWADEAPSVFSVLARYAGALGVAG